MKEINFTNLLMMKIVFWTKARSNLENVTKKVVYDKCPTLN